MRGSAFLKDITSVRSVSEKPPGTSQWIFLDYILSSCWFCLSNNRREIWEEKLQLLPQQRELIVKRWTLLFWLFFFAVVVLVLWVSLKNPLLWVCFCFGFFCFGFFCFFFFLSGELRWKIHTGKLKPTPITGRFPCNCRWLHLFWLATNYRMSFSVLSLVVFPVPFYVSQILCWRRWTTIWAICHQHLPLSNAHWLRSPKFPVPHRTIIKDILLPVSMANAFWY